MSGSAMHIDYDKVDFEKIFIGEIKSESRKMESGPVQNNYSIEIMYKYDFGSGKLKIVTPRLVSSYKGITYSPEYQQYNIVFKLSDESCTAPDYYKGSSPEDVETFWHKLYARVQELLYTRCTDFKWKNKGSMAKTIDFSHAPFPVGWQGPTDPSGLELEGEPKAFQRLKLIYREYTCKRDGKNKLFKTEFYPAYADKSGQTSKPYDWEFLKNKSIICKGIIDMSRVATAGPRIFYTKNLHSAIVYDATAMKKMTGIEDLQEKVSTTEVSLQRMKIEREKNDDLDAMLNQDHENDEERSEL